MTLNVRASLASLVTICLAVPLSAQISIDFDSDSTGPKLDPFTSVDSSEVHFTDSIADGLEVVSGTGVGGTQALYLGRDDQDLAVNTIRMAFDEPMLALSLSFGNDQEGEYVARLRGLDGTDAVIIQNTATPNFNGDTDQTISVTSNPLRCFDFAEFAYVDAGGDPIDLEELIDDVQLTPCATVPAGGTNALLALALSLLLGGALLLRRRTHTA